MSEKLEQLNDASTKIAEKQFLDCCGSNNWAQKMAEARPFSDVAELIGQAEKIWQSLNAKDWLEAFAAHPKIGAKKAAPAQQAQSAKWSEGEQAGTQTAAESVLNQLAEANRLYENRFGFIFIVCATGKSAEEMLELCRNRLGNETNAEIRIAAEEQRKITEIRLKKLIESK